MGKFTKNVNKYRLKRKYRVNKQDRTKSLVDGKQPGKLEMMARNYIGPLGTIAKTVYGITKLINSEHKFIDLSSSSNPSSTGSVTNMSTVAQGTGDNNRIGNSLLFQDLLFNFICSMHSSATVTWLRILIVCDKEFDGATPAVTDILTSASVNSPLNMNFSKRFVVLKNKILTLTSAARTGANGKFYMKLLFHGQYDGANASNADSKENQVLVLLLSSEATNTPTFSFYSRVKFTDT